MGRCRSSRCTCMQNEEVDVQDEEVLEPEATAPGVMTETVEMREDHTVARVGEAPEAREDHTVASGETVELR